MMYILVIIIVIKSTRNCYYMALSVDSQLLSSLVWKWCSLQRSCVPWVFYLSAVILLMVWWSTCQLEWLS